VQFDTEFIEIGLVGMIENCFSFPTRFYMFFVFSQFNGKLPIGN